MLQKDQNNPIVVKSLCPPHNRVSDLTATGGTAPPAKNNYGKVIAYLGETQAAKWLEDNGFVILERNWHFGRFAEIDIIARDPSNLLRFIEVKTRRIGRNSSEQESFVADCSGKSSEDRTAREKSNTRVMEARHMEAGHQALESITRVKRRKIAASAKGYLAMARIENPSCQLDVIVITFEFLNKLDGLWQLRGAALLHVSGVICN